jgi:hypothetical protein
MALMRPAIGILREWQPTGVALAGPFEGGIDMDQRKKFQR